MEDRLRTEIYQLISDNTNLNFTLGTTELSPLPSLTRVVTNIFLAIVLFYLSPPATTHTSGTVLVYYSM